LKFGSSKADQGTGFVDGGQFSEIPIRPRRGEAHTDVGRSLYYGIFSPANGMSCRAPAPSASEARFQYSGLDHPQLGAKSAVQTWEHRTLR
jgi:hypothetical protein